MTQEEIQMVAFEIILHSGDARTLIHESFGLMREGKEEEALERLEEANEKITLGHKAQTSLLHTYADGKEVNVDVIMVHAQDHLMTVITLREVALEMLELHKRIK